MLNDSQEKAPNKLLTLWKINRKKVLVAGATGYLGQYLEKKSKREDSG